MTQMATATVPLAAPIPHHLATEILDKPTGNWTAWERTILACLTFVGLQHHPAGVFPCPDPAVDPRGAANWRANDAAVVAFLAAKAAPGEQACIAGRLTACAVWEALAARHSEVDVDAGAQIRLIREAFSIRYGEGEPPAATSARIHALAARIFALGPVTQDTFTSAVMFNAVQGDLESAAGEQLPQSARKPPDPAPETPRTDLPPLCSVCQRFGHLAVTCPRRSGGMDTPRAEGLVGASSSSFSAGPSTRARYVSQLEEDAMATISAELWNIQQELLPAISDLLAAVQPDSKERGQLLKLAFEAMERLDAIVVEPNWDDARRERRGAVKEAQKLQSMLEMENPPPYADVSDVSPGEQTALSEITSELSKVQQEFAPAVANFLRAVRLGQQWSESDRAWLSESLLQALERLDAVAMEYGWEDARRERHAVVKEVEQLQEKLEAPQPAVSQGEHDALLSIGAELSKIQHELAPAVEDFVHGVLAGQALNTKRRGWLSELSLQALEHLDGILVEQGWEEARRERRWVVEEVVKLQNELDALGSS
ncbi:hypothetical protein B0H10DRAFT_2001498 [Mycena sp. CBHHK59/15]|nr:hypothetical protein B0H10DRAFT_2001498 [Mycena sp. CBHHK59/15]